MAWYDEAVFYHIYPLGMTGAPKHNPYTEPVERLNNLLPWIPHIKEIGCNAIYIGPLFESVGHGYETTDYKKLDSRLGTNATLKNFVAECHKEGIRVIFDGVFNHTGRDFFAFKDIRKNRENSKYLNWYCNVNFSANNSYNDGFSYTNWGGHDLLVKLNQKNPQVVDYICDVIRYWAEEFDVDGIRLDAADVMDFDYMKAFRKTAFEVKADFWLMGEVIHGDYTRWANETTLHSVTNYVLHKAFHSAHSDHNYFELAHTVNRVRDMFRDSTQLYTFVDNHDVERIYTILKNKAHLVPVYILLYTLPGIPSVYYGSEFGIEGKKQRGSDDSLRPALDIADYKDAANTNPTTKLIATLGKLRHNCPALSYGDYKELVLTTTHFAFERTFDGKQIITAVNNSDQEVTLNLPCCAEETYRGILSGAKAQVDMGRIQVTIPANSGDIWVSQKLYTEALKDIKPIKIEKIPAKQKATVPAKKAESAKQNSEHEKPAVKAEEISEKPKASVPANKPFEEMSIEELQEAILEKMAKNGPVTDYMLGTVRENTHHGSLITWVKSFR